ncbi:MAG: TolC family protein [Chitinophagaceae bacterium]|nr:TolC family protein [Chitinophagaceae bacterium]MBK7558943.1 TolC family protein [Chitinophagaceae bacterium]MBK9530953.1 TolC family protein [Chitinophagaceae bacterium]
MKISFKILNLFFFAIIFTQPLFAQNKLTVEQAIIATIENNYDIQLLRNDSSSYALDKSYARAAFLPRLNATTGLVYNNNNQKQLLADGSKRESKAIRSNNLSGSVQLNWTLFDGFKMFATRDKLSQFVLLGELNIKNQLVNSVALVINNYFNIVRQKQLLKAIEEQMSINEDRVTLAQKKISVGLGAKPELLQGMVDLNAQKAARLKQQTVIDQLKEQLNQLMNVEMNTRYEVSDSITFREDIIVGDILAAVETTNPQLLVTKKNIDIGYLTLKERKADRYPVVSFNSAYNYSKTTNQTVINSFTPLFNRNNGFNYGIGITIPILNGFNVKRQIQQAQLDIDWLNISYKNQKSQIDLGITNAFKDYELQKKTLALEEENILLAKENVSIALERLRLGISTYLELRETQKSLELAYDRLIAARYNTKLAETELLRLKGDLVK